MNRLKALISLFLNLWNSLPHQAQAGVICFASAAIAEGGKILSDFPNTCISWYCAQHDLWLMVVAGVAAVRIFYMLPSHRVAQLVISTQPPEPPPEQPPLSGPPAKAM